MKYLITDEQKEFAGRTLHRVQYLVDLPGIHAGDMGGWLESENNLWQNDGVARILDNAIVFGEARVIQNAVIRDNACALEKAFIRDNADVGENAHVSGEAVVCGDARVYGSARVGQCARVACYAHVHGSAEVWGCSLVTGGTRIHLPPMTQTEIIEYQTRWLENDRLARDQTERYLQRINRLTVSGGPTITEMNEYWRDGDRDRAFWNRAQRRGWYNGEK